MNNLIDLHTHSVLSKHAYSSVTENIQYAYDKGLKVYGISDHQNDDQDVGVHKYAIANLRIIPSDFKGMKILKGVELNILDSGEVFLPKGYEKNLDYAIASIHHFCYKSTHTKEENTLAYIKACENPLVKILGHIDDQSYPVDYEKVVLKAKETHTLIELNNSSLVPGGSRGNTLNNDRIIYSLCKEYGVPIILNSDAHICYDVGKCDESIAFLNSIDFPKELVLNFNKDLINEFFGLDL